jgi:hypothetical protein
MVREYSSWHVLCLVIYMSRLTPFHCAQSKRQAKYIKKGSKCRTLFKIGDKSSVVANSRVHVISTVSLPSRVLCLWRENDRILDEFIELAF